jgi:hypothetical protein
MWIRQQIDDGTEKVLASGGNSEFSERITEWDLNVDASLGRGTGVVGTDLSYVQLRRTDGTKVYIYVDTGTTVVCSATRP